MESSERVEKLIQKTLDQFEQPDILPPNPYLYTQIRQRLEQKRETKGLLAANLKLALLAVLVLLNIVVAYRHITGMEGYTQTDARQELIEILAGDLNLNSDRAHPSIIE
jgi:hypothetical protein